MELCGSFKLPEEPDPVPLLDGYGLSHWMKVIRGMGVMRGVDHDLLKRLHTQQTRQPNMEDDEVYILARGKEPRHESTELKFHIDGLKESDPRATRVDFRDRGFGVDVYEGQLLAEMVYHGPGEDGVDVCGRRIPYNKEGEAQPLNVSPHVIVEKIDNRTTYKAGIDGIVDNTHLESLALQPTLHIKRSVDLQIGNLNTAFPIVIDGDVSSGLVVQSGRSIAVRGSVEQGATLRSDGDIVVDRGVMAKAHLQSKKDILIKFAQGAELVCMGDLKASSYLFDCEVRAQGQLICEGRGRPDRGAVVGGVLNAVSGMVLGSVGSKSNLTTLVAGIDLELELQLKELEGKVKELQREMKRQIRMLPVNILKKGWQERIKALPTAQAAQCRQRLRHLAGVKSECKACECEISALGSQKASQNGRSEITVQGVLISDVKVMLSDCEEIIYDDFNRVKIALESKQIVKKILD
jgi:uncharacterized protein (DUF342 family)